MRPQSAQFAPKSKACACVRRNLAGHKKDIEFTVNKFSPRTPVAVADIGVDEIYFACGYKAGVIAVEDENFSNKIVSLLSE